MKDKLMLLDMSKDFNISYDEINLGYAIYDSGSDLSCMVYDNGNIKYYVGDVYNSGINYAEINMERLRLLEKFVNLLKSYDK